MIRTVELIEHLPSFIQDFREIKNILNAEEPELQSLEDDSEKIKDNMFVLHSNEDGIARYEKMFGIVASKNESINERQANVLAHYTNSVVYTTNGLIERLNVICGVGNCTVELIPDKYTIVIKLHGKIENLLNTVNSILPDMIPANMLWQTVIKQNKHIELQIFPNYLLGQFTHYEVAEESIKDYISSTCKNISNYNAKDIESIHCEHLLNFGMRKV